MTNTKFIVSKSDNFKIMKEFGEVFGEPISYRIYYIKIGKDDKLLSTWRNKKELLDVITNFRFTFNPKDKSLRNESIKLLQNFEKETPSLIC